MKAVADWLVAELKNPQLYVTMALFWAAIKFGERRERNRRAWTVTAAELILRFIAGACGVGLLMAVALRLGSRQTKIPRD